MKTTIQYLEEAKKKLDINSDYAAAKWLGISSAALSQYKTGKRIIDDYAAAKIANALGIPAIEVIAVANAEREKDEKRREFWRDMLSRSMAAGMMIFAVISTGYSERAAAGIKANNLQTIHYARLKVGARAGRGLRWAGVTVNQEDSMARSPGP